MHSVIRMSPFYVVLKTCPQVFMLKGWLLAVTIAGPSIYCWAVNTTLLL